MKKGFTGRGLTKVKKHWTRRQTQHTKNWVQENEHKIMRSILTLKASI